MKQETFRREICDLTPDVPEVFHQRVEAFLQEKVAQEVNTKEAIMNYKAQKIPTVKKSVVSMAVVIVLFCVMGTGALAAVLKAWGIIDFAGRQVNTYVPPRYEDSIVHEDLTIDTARVTCTIQESYYDGRILRITARVVPKETVLLIGGNASPNDPVEDIFPNPERHSMSLAEYALANYDGQMANVSLHTGRDDAHSFIPNDDGSTTLYMECVFEDDLAEREVELRLVYMPVVISADALGVYDSSAREITFVSMVFHSTNVEMYTYNESMHFPQVGVKITNVTLIVTPLEIRYALDFEITDLEAFSAQNGGLWFEFIDPARTETVLSAQRVSDGLRSTGSIGRLDGLYALPDEVGTVYRQTGSIGLDSIGGQYTVRAYNAWDKTRFEAVTFNVSER